MILSVTVTSSLKQQIAALGRCNDDFPSKVSQIVRKNAIEVKNNAMALVPVSTGHLRDSLEAIFVNSGFSAIIGSWLPYAAQQEYNELLDHSVRDPRLRKVNTKSGKVGSVIKGTVQFNPNATFGFLRKSLAVVSGFFEQDLKDLCDKFGRAFQDGEL